MIRKILLGQRNLFHGHNPRVRQKLYAVYQVKFHADFLVASGHDCKLGDLPIYPLFRSPANFSYTLPNYADDRIADCRRQTGLS